MDQFLWIKTDFSATLFLLYLKKYLIESYRKALTDSLSKEDLRTEILILPYVSWAETRGDLFEDIVHPNDLGFIEIDKSIARIIKSDLKNIRNNK